MIFRIIFVAVFSFSVLHQMVRGGTTYCDYEIEYSGRDPEYVLTEVRRSVYTEYESVKYDLEQADFGSDVSKNEQRIVMLDALENARYDLDDYLNELYVSMLERMRSAYEDYSREGAAEEYERLVDQIRFETETQLRPRLTVFREHCSRPQSLLGGVLGGVQSMVRGLVGGL